MNPLQGGVEQGRDVADDETTGRPRPVQASAGPFAGWWSWSGRDAFEQLIGPFYVSPEDGGSVRCGFLVEPKHLNGRNSVHGGCMMAFADFALFAISRSARGGRRGAGVTVSLNSEFLGPGHLGERVEATGEVTRGGGSLTFVRGLCTADGRPMLAFSGIIKALRPRQPGEAAPTSA